MTVHSVCGIFKMKSFIISRTPPPFCI